MPGFHAINAHPTPKDAGIRAVSPSQGAIDIDSTDIDDSGSEDGRSSGNTPDTESATDQTTSDTDTPDTAALPPLDPKCESFNQCRAESGDHRKVVSHIFGRNKAETRRIPDDCWVRWCRMHYQRRTYRGNTRNNWHLGQLELVREQLNRFEERTNIQSWTISLRKKEQRELDLENAAVAAGLITLAPPSSATRIQPGTTAPETAHIAASTTTSPTATAESTQSSCSAVTRYNHVNPCSDSTAKDETNIIFTTDASTTTSRNTSNTASTTPKPPSVDHSRALSATSSAASDEADNTDADKKPTPPQVWERFLVPYLGPQKTFADVRAVCDVIEREFDNPDFQARAPKKRVFPGVEFLPVFPDTKVKRTNAKRTTPTARGTKRKAADTRTVTTPAEARKRPRLVRDVKG